MKVTVYGKGLSGLFASYVLASRGLEVRCCHTGRATSAFFSGAFSLFLNQNMESSLYSLNNPEEHPLTELICSKRIEELFPDIINELSSAGVKLAGNISDESKFLADNGVIIKANFVLNSMKGASLDNVLKNSTLIITKNGDFKPSVELKNVSHHRIPREVTFRSEDEIIKYVLNLIKEHNNRYNTILTEAIHPWLEFEKIHDSILSETGVEIWEMPSMKSTTIGMRLTQLLEKKLSKMSFSQVKIESIDRLSENETTILATGAQWWINNTFRNVYLKLLSPYPKTITIGEFYPSEFLNLDPFQYHPWSLTFLHVNHKMQIVDPAGNPINNGKSFAAGSVVTGPFYGLMLSLATSYIACQSIFDEIKK